MNSKLLALAGAIWVVLCSFVHASGRSSDRPPRPKPYDRGDSIEHAEAQAYYFLAKSVIVATLADALGSSKGLHSEDPDDMNTIAWKITNHIHEDLESALFARPQESAWRDYVRQRIKKFAPIIQDLAQERPEYPERTLKQLWDDVQCEGYQQLQKYVSAGHGGLWQLMQAEGSDFATICLLEQLYGPKSQLSLIPISCYHALKALIASTHNNVRLDLSEAPLQDLPRCMSTMDICELDLSNTRIVDIDHKMPWESLEVLDLQGCSKLILTEQFRGFDRLENLNLADTFLEDTASLFKAVQDAPCLRQLTVDWRYWKEWDTAYGQQPRNKKETPLKILYRIAGRCNGKGPNVSFLTEDVRRVRKYVETLGAHSSAHGAII